MEQVLKLVTQIHADVQNIDKKLTEHIADETQSAANLIAELRGAAFVVGDAEAHKREHEAMVAAMERRAAFWTDIAASVAKWGVLGFLGFLVVAGWRAFLMGPK